MGALYRKVDIRDKKLRKTAPNALQLLKMGEDGKLAVDKDVLQLFDNQEIQDKKVCIISVAGAMRQGKSFLLNFFLHFLNKKCQKGETKKNWISREGNLQTGFFWKTQSERVTEGILIWSEVFLTKVDDEEIAVVLMDTQGTFDNDLNMAQVTGLFATSVLISSVQIYNIKNQIALNDLHNLQFFAEYAKFQQNNRKPFQKLLILEIGAFLLNIRLEKMEATNYYQVFSPNMKNLIKTIYKKPSLQFLRKLVLFYCLSPVKMLCRIQILPGDSKDLEKIFFSYKAKIKRKEFLRNLGSYFGIGSGIGGGIGSAVGGTAAAVQVGTVLTGATTALEGATILSAVGTVAGGIALGAVGGIFAGVLAVGGFALKYISSSDNKEEPAARAIEKTNEEKKN